MEGDGMSDAIEPFRLAVPQAELDDLRQRLTRTRWPEREAVEDWSQGAPLDRVRALCDHWRDRYDWRRCEAMLNGLGQHRTTIDGLGIYFLHVRSPVRGALPLLLTHGWPGSVIEFHKVIGPLTDPAAHGGDPADAFDVIVPSLPGYGFSDKPAETGWGVERIADAWITLVRRLGYDRFVAQGGDWGAAVTNAIAAKRPEGCLAIHLNLAIAFPGPDQMADLTEAEQAALADFQEVQTTGMGYAVQQSTRPQTLGYGLVDSPAAQAAWIYEKLHFWTDNDGAVETLLSMDEMLDNIMLYWLPGAGASSARLYWESLASGFVPRPIELPTAISVYPGELVRPSRRWADAYYSDIIQWHELDRGGHFPAFEQPAIFVDELRNAFRRYQGSR